MSKGPTETAVKKQADRLLTLPGRPDNATEIARALLRYAETEYHLNTIVQHLLDNQEFFPAPKAIREAAMHCLKEPPPKFRTPNPNCSVCDGSGFHVFDRNGVAVSENCACRVVGAKLPPDREQGNLGPVDVMEAFKYLGGKQ